jgi:hypothetical protein
VQLAYEVKRKLDSTPAGLSEVVESSVLIVNVFEGVLGDPALALSHVNSQALSHESLRDTPIQVVEALDDSSFDGVSSQAAFARFVNLFTRREAQRFFPNLAKIIYGCEQIGDVAVQFGERLNAPPRKVRCHGGILPLTLDGASGRQRCAGGRPSR